MSNEQIWPVATTLNSEDLMAPRNQLAFLKSQKSVLFARPSDRHQGWVLDDLVASLPGLSLVRGNSEH